MANTSKSAATAEPTKQNASNTTSAKVDNSTSKDSTAATTIKTSASNTSKASEEKSSNNVTAKQTSEKSSKIESKKTSQTGNDLKESPSVIHTEYNPGDCISSTNRPIRVYMRANLSSPYRLCNQAVVDSKVVLGNESTGYFVPVTYRKSGLGVLSGYVSVNR